jgi:hypothetical protein
MSGGSVVQSHNATEPYHSTNPAAARPRRRQDALTPQQFSTRVYGVLLRYETLAQFDQGTQGTLPGPAFECLRDDWGVGHECFASPLNGPRGPGRPPGYAPSAFPAVDRAFVRLFCVGARGA